jgi:hypothetical protein
MPPKQRQKVVLLAVLGVVFAAVAIYQFGFASAGAPSSSSPPRRARTAATPTTGGGRTAPQVPQVVDVHVERLDQAPPDVEASGRNPFRFQPRPAPQPPPPPVPSPPPATSAGRAGDPSAPPAPPPPPPISLKYIGMVAGADAGGRVAVLSDGKFVYYGREGDIIEGRYRVVKNGEESIQIEHVDGRGRQTIRLTGA